MTDDTVVTAPPKKTVRPLKGYEYVILQASPADSSWKERGTINGRDAEHAIRQYASANGNAPGPYVAVLKKSFKPLNVVAETVTTLKLEEVK